MGLSCCQKKSLRKNYQKKLNLHQDGIAIQAETETKGLFKSINTVGLSSERGQNGTLSSEGDAYFDGASTARQ